MTKALKVVTERKEGDVTYYDFRCPYRIGCGAVSSDPDAESFYSLGWTSREDAEARGRQHIVEHETGEDPDRETELMPELVEFQRARGINPDTGQAAVPEKWEF